MKGIKPVLLISSVLLAGSILFSGIWIARSIKERSYVVKTDGFSLYEKGLLTLEEAAHYLSMQEGEFYFIIKDLEIEKNTEKASWNPEQSLKYLTYNGVNYFSKEELDRWIRFNINLSGERQ
ncbi:hypothetical protein [Paenibacillus tengchongensis]|uniref:hypothetical protein n=1 Tax=Paenibacillus tengchongensis TaxID=2608684 RepID=UPI00124C28BB|nr:hypothetical protein [Paenibacillus tengchongensis]